MSAPHRHAARRLLVAFALLALPAAAHAQTWGLRGSADVGAQWFTASESFEAVLGTTTGTVVGGAGEFVFAKRLFANVRVSRFEKSGQRVFVFNGQTFELGIDTTVRITPVELTGGYRFGGLDRRVVPYVGAGVGWHRYRETSDFADDPENVDETFRGVHLLAGVEARLARWVAVAGDVQWTTVPDALGTDPNSVSAEFGEDDLGGTALRIKVVIGR